MATALQAAAAMLGQLGWHVFPVRPAAKLPLIKDWPRRASTDAHLIEGWWRRWPDANVGIVTGAPSGLVVLDVDPDKGGEDSLALLERDHEALPVTVAASTGGGGRHVYFAHGVADVRNSASSPRLGPGLDVRGVGGYVVAPPSVHATGRAYAWLIGPEDMPRPARLPPWLRALMVQRPSARRGEHRRSERRKLSDGARVLAGERNDTLFRRACALRSKGMEAEEVLVEMCRVNREECPLPLDDDELERLVESACRYEPGQLDPRRAECNDLSNAQRLVEQHGADLRHCPAHRWLAWDGRRFVARADAQARRRAHETVEAMFATASEELEALQAKTKPTSLDEILGGPSATDENPKEAKAADEVREVIAVAKARVAWARKSHMSQRVTAMLLEASVGGPIHVEARALDRHPMLLNVENGTLDLEKGELRSHERAHLLTKLAPVAFDPRATAPLWLLFLRRAMGGDAEMVAFLQRAVGWSLTGLVRDHALLFCWGSGGNGKTTFLHALRGLLGDYAHQADFGLFLRKNFVGNGPTPELARLAGKRFVVSIEVGEGRRLAEEVVKQLTGGDAIAARFCHQDGFEFEMEGKLWLAANHRPQVSGADLAMWRRIQLVPFDVTIPEPEQDKLLPEKLKLEWPGILAWAAEGCLAWQRDGLLPPPRVRAATEAYRVASDTLGAFLKERCLVDRANRSVRVRSSHIHEAHQRWSGESLSARAFSERMTDHGFEKLQSDGMWWLGVGLRHESESTP